DLYQKVQLMLADKLQAEKAKIEERLRRIKSAGGLVSRDRLRRPYPPVLPKYKNPEKPTEVWSGRGKQPLWVREQLEGQEARPISDCRGLLLEPSCKIDARRPSRVVLSLSRVLSISESTASLVWINSISRARAEVARASFKAWVISPPPYI